MTCLHWNICLHYNTGVLYLVVAKAGSIFNESSHSHVPGDQGQLIQFM